MPERTFYMKELGDNLIEISIDDVETTVAEDQQGHEILVAFAERVRNGEEVAIGETWDDLMEVVGINTNEY